MVTCASTQDDTYILAVQHDIADHRKDHKLNKYSDFSHKYCFSPQEERLLVPRKSAMTFRARFQDSQNYQTQRAATFLFGASVCVIRKQNACYTQGSQPSSQIKFPYVLCITVCEIFDTVPINKILGNGREIFK